MTGITDIHTRILPGIDDGSRDRDESRRMLEVAYQQGMCCIIATPHYSRRRLPPQIYELAERLPEETGRIAPDFKTGLGQETYFHEGLAGNLKQGKALTLENTRYALVEFDPQASYHSLYQTARKTTTARYIPAIAHVERYFYLREGGGVEELIQCGCRLQMNCSSPEGNGIWSRDVRWCRRQVAEGRIHMLDTDMYRMDYRKPDMEEFLQWLEKHMGEHEVRAPVSSNADKILQERRTGE